MKTTRISLYYLASYLWLGGLALIFAPKLSAELMLSNGDYPAIMLRALGMFMIGLGIIVAQVIRRRIMELYGTTLLVRLFFLFCLMTFYLFTRDPFFLVLFTIVVIGVMLTGLSFLLDHQRGEGVNHHLID
ncbi:MAG: hypothetical protein KZQ93_11825 [Candidatus Thiodiazotropha sp. (ex Monitilora ramsayi)]|nr:hypothetical protein [Candidatus Thiodiazotropha sp. (ex Monitilora ramsayi)]